MKNKKVLDINFSDEWRNKKSKIAHFALKRLYKRKKSIKKYLNIKNLQNTEQKISIGHAIIVEFLNYLEGIERRRRDFETSSPIIGEVVHAEFNVNSWLETFGSVWQKPWEGFLGDDRDRRNDVSLNKFVAWEQRVGKTRSVYL